MSSIRRFVALVVLTAGWAVPVWGAPAACTVAARSGVRLGNGTESLADVASDPAAGLVDVARNAHLADGTRASGGHVAVGPGASIFDVGATVLVLARGAQVRGAQGSPSSLPADPRCEAEPAPCGELPVRVAAGGPPRVLPPGQYGDVVVDSGAELVLAEGSYAFCSLTVGRRGRVAVTGAPASIDVHGGVRLLNGAHLGPDDGVAVPVVRVGGSSVTLGAHAVLRGFLAAPAARVVARDGVELVGGACVDALVTGRRGRLGCGDAAPPPTTTSSSSTTTSTTSSTTTSSAPTTTTSTTTSTSTAPSTSTSTTAPSTTTSSTTSSTTSTTAPPTTTSTTSSTTTSTAPPTTTTSSTTPTTSTTAPPPPTTTSTTTSTTVSSTTTTSTTSSTSTTTSSTSTTSTTSTTLLQTVTCGPQGLFVTMSLSAGGLGGVTLDLSYPPPLDIPGNGFETDDSGFTDLTGRGGTYVLNDRDTGADGVDDSVRIVYALVGQQGIGPGAVFRERLDCPNGSEVSPDALGCAVVAASDTSGNTVGGVTCALSAAGTQP